MISGAEAASDIFSVFHDGGIIRYSTTENDLVLDVEIPYLAKRVNTAYNYFSVKIHEIQNLTFSTWPKIQDANPSIFQSPIQIFEPGLEILSGETEGDLIKVICNQPSPHCEYCGGELFFSCSGATVTDEGAKEYSIEELRELAETYWREWSKGNE